MMFTGQVQHTMDAKGRTALPARFRRVLDPEQNGETIHLVILPWFSGCARVFPKLAWEAERAKIEAAINKKDPLGLDERASSFRRLLFGRAVNVTTDGSGRILVPQDCRIKAGLDRQVVWMGVGHYLELWQPERLEEKFGPDSMEALNESFMSLIAGGVD